MKMNKFFLSALALGISTGAAAQEATPVQAVRVAEKPATVLPANT